MSKKYKWGAESVVKNRKGKEVPDALSWDNVKVTLFGKEIEGITSVVYGPGPDSEEIELKTVKIPAKLIMEISDEDAAAIKKALSEMGSAGYAVLNPEEKITFIEPRDNFVAFDDHLRL